MTHQVLAFARPTRCVARTFAAHPQQPNNQNTPSGGDRMIALTIALRYLASSGQAPDVLAPRVLNETK